MSLVLQSNNGPIFFGSIINTPWVRGFYGELPWFFPYFQCRGACWKDVTFAAKTVTLYPHKGRVPLKKNGRPKYPLTRFVYWKPFQDFMVNAWALSNPGLVYCLAEWESREKPFIISVISLQKTLQGRLAEMKSIAKLLLFFAKQVSSPFAIQFNGGCANAGAHNSQDEEDNITEIIETAKILRDVGMPIIFNCSPVISSSIIKEVYPFWSALWVGNVVPWGHHAIDWSAITPNGISPLQARGLGVSGGYSGPASKPLVISFIQNLQEEKVVIPIIASNGIRTPDDVHDFFKASPHVRAVGVGSIAYTNPADMSAVIREAQHR
jgi:dihydroorotate dehydrogenase